MVGDDGNDRQYRSLLAFDLSSLPANATITDAQVVLKRRYNSSYGDVTSLGAITFDLAIGHFGAEAQLRQDDFFAPATHTNVGSFSDGGTTSPAALNASGIDALNQAKADGNNHFQLRLQQPPHPGGNLANDRLIYYSANESDTTLQPQLIINYTTDAQPDPDPEPQVSGVFYYHNDHLGTPQTLTADNQTVAWAASYTPFGKAALTTEVVTNNLRFAGQYYDQETGLHHNGYRTYNPDLGRYITADPLGILLDRVSPQIQSAAEKGVLELPVLTSDGYLNNLYAYVDSNPLTTTDFSGLFGRTASSVSVEALGLLGASGLSSKGHIPIDPTDPKLPGTFDPAETTSTVLQCPSQPRPPLKPRDQCMANAILKHAACKAKGGVGCTAGLVARILICQVRNPFDPD